MRIAVVTPYYKEQKFLIERCIGSVKSQCISPHSCEINHILISDGHPQDWIDTLGVRHLRLDRSHNDYGNTPRSIGALLAASEGYDAVAFLDADNWFDFDHVQACIDAAYRSSEPVDYVVARRRLVRWDGSVMPIEAGDDGSFEHVDTNCYFLLWGAFHTISRWATMPKPLAIIGDRIYRSSLDESGLKFAATSQKTVNYLCTWAAFFRALGESVPDYAKENIDPRVPERWYRSLDRLSQERVQRLVGLRLQ